MGDRYTYTHPEEKGFGEHHADPNEPPLHQRTGAHAENGDALRSALAMVDPTEEQTAKLDGYLSRTMADLDMGHGTTVEHVDTDEDTGHLIMEWHDRHGDLRRTAITPEQAAELFQAETAKAGGAA